MQLFKQNDKKIELVKENPFRLEKEMQELVQGNMATLFNLQFVRSEFQLNGLRIDSLAFDKDSSSFVIIEYKKDRNFSVIDQGMSYLSLMLNNKAEFILEYNEKCKMSLKRDDIDWSQSRVMFVSTSFTQYQIEAINFKDLPIELWEIHRYSNNTVLFDQHIPSSTQASIKSVSKKNENVDVISKEVKTYSEQEHLSIATAEVSELYERFKNLVLSISPEIKVKAKKYYIAFQIKSNITDVCIQKKSIKVFINLEKGKLDDPKKLTRDISKIGHWGNGDYELQISSDDDLEYVISLVRQSYKLNR
ncbi:hypothetical protein F9K33_13150 [bacterium]|nr:MAG: hypothetical protein F9K33_13150 [bacterium]